MKIERQLQGTLNTVFTELIKEQGLGEKLQPYTTQEEGRADITLKNKSGKAIFFIELKDPTAKDGKSVFDGNVLFREVERAQRLGIKYFGNCNFLACAFFDVKKIYEKVSVSEGFFTVKEIEKLSLNYLPSKETEKKLRAIAQFYIDRALEIVERKPVKYSPVDELFIFKIRKLIEVYGHAISDKVYEKYKNDRNFEKEIQRYTQSQLWNKPSSYEEIENLTYIAILMLISKLIFYKAYVDNQTWSDLSPMVINDNIVNSDELEVIIWNYFDTFKEITGDFELLIGERADIVFQIPFVSPSIIELVKDVLETGGHYNFSVIAYDIIGRIFEELIREDERHKLGQYFTPPDVIDLINVFSIHKGSDKVFDPSCGSGTFLVRAYERKKQLLQQEDKGVRHEILLNEIYGNDLSGYPAYLSMLNLAIRNTRRPSYPKIINKDFFAISDKTKVKLHNIKGEIEAKELPKFDAIIGNPPYTRQEDIGVMQGTQNKAKIQKLISGKYYFEPNARTSIYGYFFYHSTSFLKENGYLSFIVQNSWLDTEYGIELQKFLLEYYEIVAIIDSEVERFFPTASVNTSIVIAKKQTNIDKRDANDVKFILLTKPLSEIYNKYKGVYNFYQELINSNKDDINEYYKISLYNQKELAQHSKWGQFLRAPKIYFDILKKGKDKFKPLSELAKISRGYTTGNNNFFILKKINNITYNNFKSILNNRLEYTTMVEIIEDELSLVINGFNELWLIESKYLKSILTSPKDANNYILSQNDIENFIISVDIEKKNLKKIAPFLYSYIIHAERFGIHEKNTLNSRNIWYNIGSKAIPSLSFSYMINDYGKTYIGEVYTNDNFHNIYPKNNHLYDIFYYMNSTISWLIQQVAIRNNFGDGVGKLQKYELDEFPVIILKYDKINLKINNIQSYKEELGSLESIKTVNPERVKLDTAILEAIGYTNKKERDNVLLELYKATYQLIDSRLQKAQSLKSVKVQRNKVQFEVYIDQLNKLLIEGKYEAKNTIKFAKELEKIVQEITSEKRLQQKILNVYWKSKFKMAYNQKDIIDRDQMKLF